MLKEDRILRNLQDNILALFPIQYPWPSYAPRINYILTNVCDDPMVALQTAVC